MRSALLITRLRRHKKSSDFLVLFVLFVVSSLCVVLICVVYHYSRRGGGMPTVRFTRNIQRLVACPTREAEGETLSDVMDNYFRANEQARGYVLDDQGKLRQHMAIFTDGRHVEERERLSV